MGRKIDWRSAAGPIAGDAAIGDSIGRERKGVRLRTFGGLTIECETASDNKPPRPRSLAILALLAAAGPRGMSRAQVLAVLWPDSPPDRGRHALSQALYTLRGDLGADAVLSGPSLRLDARVVTSDVDDFQQANRAKRWADAAALYAGPFLDGFTLADAPDFDRWADERRTTLSLDAARAIETVAKELGSEGKFAEAATHWLRLAIGDPLDSRFALGYMEACVASGNRAGALAHGRTHVELLRTELDTEPDAPLAELMIRLRQTDAPRAPVTQAESVPRFAEVVAAGEVVPARPVVAAQPVRRRSVWASLVAPATIAVVGVVMMLAWRGTATPKAVTPVLAVGRIRDLTSGDPLSLGERGVFSEMLATSLGRISELRIVANSRMLELEARNSDTSRAAVTDAGRRAGATEILEGELVPANDGRLRLEVRRVDLARGLVRGAYSVTGDDRFALFDSVTARVTADLGLGNGEGSLVEVSTRSPIAYRLYDDGLRAFYQFDIAEASRLFRAAIREDSTFAMATYYAWQCAIETDDSAQVGLGRRAMQLASHASEHDRLLIRTHVGTRDQDLRAISAAESLVARYPRDPEGLMRAAQVTFDHSAARALLERSIAIDSAAGVRIGAICRMCEALRMLSYDYQWNDSMAASEATLRRWMRLRPDDFQPWTLLADLLVGVGRANEATAAQRRAIAMGVSPGDTAELALIWALRSDDFDTFDKRCPAMLQRADSTHAVTYRWYCLIGLRAEGRYTEAEALQRDGRIPTTSISRRLERDDYHSAILAMEMGRPRDAADEYAGFANQVTRDQRLSDAYRAHAVAWLLTLSATAALAAGDSARALALADSIETTGRRSLFGRDPLLHHFVRGLALARSHEDSRAVRELETSIYSATHGYTRANYELGRTLLRLGRPAEAIRFAGAALRGGIEGSTLYVTRTEMHELIAQAFAAAGQTDSASAHYAIVQRAWRDGDPAYRSRRDALLK